MTTPRRRWFRFSLRTMLVVVALLAVLLGWVGSQVNRIKGRRNALADRLVIGKWQHRDDGFTPSPPTPLNWMGESGVFWILLDDRAGADDRDRYIALFPESIVTRHWTEASTAARTDQP